MTIGFLGRVRVFVIETNVLDSAMEVYDALLDIHHSLIRPHHNNELVVLLHRRIAQLQFYPYPSMFWKFHLE
jgi:hypothetical protein